MRARWLTVFLDFPERDFERGAAFWREVTGSGLSERRGPGGEFATLLPPDGDAYLRVQRVHDGPGGCHLDLHVDLAEQSLDDAAAEAVALGAAVRYREAGEVIIVESPGGFAFCFVPWNGEKTVPSPVVTGNGTGNEPGNMAGSRVSQLSLDVPPEGFDRETAFWSALTGWDLKPRLAPDFVFLDKPPELPVGLLFQRRGQAAPGDRVAGHVDIGCAGQDQVIAQHERAGARVRGEHESWTVMTDPVNRLYCLCQAGVCACE